MPLRSIKLTIAYDGSGYHGWQAQPGLETIQQKLDEALSSLPGGKTTIKAASRTDAGVSALGQVAVIQIDSPVPTENLTVAINDLLPPEIAIVEAIEVPRSFEVTLGAKNKHYRYTIYNGNTRPVLRIKHCWYVPGKLDIEAMSSAAEKLVGTMDFKSFASAADTRTNTIRTIFRCDVTDDGDWIHIDVEGDAFLYNMVRNIAGTLVEAGAGRLKPDRIPEIIEAKNRTAAGPMAPAAGLCLLRIRYHQ